MLNIFSNVKINTSIWVNQNRKGDVYNNHYKLELVAKLHK